MVVETQNAETMEAVKRHAATMGIELVDLEQEAKPSAVPSGAD